MKVYQVILFTTWALSLFGCQWRQPPPVDTLIVALESKPRTLDPRYATDSSGQRITNLIFSSIVRVGPDLKIQGDLAKSWSYKNKIYTFQLYPNAKFHDGSSLRTEDLIFTFEEYKKKSSPFSTSLKSIKSVSAKYNGQEHWLSLELFNYSAVLLTDLNNIKILSKNHMKSVKESFHNHPMGSGKFKFVEEKNNNIYLQTPTEHFQEAPKISKLVFKVIKDGNTRFQKTYKGKIDIAQSNMPFSKIQVFQRSPRFEVSVQPGLSMTYILLNLQDEFLKDKKVRQAIFQSLNREEIIKYNLEGLAEPATSLLTPANPYFHSTLKYVSLPQEEVAKVIKRLKSKKFTLKTSNSQAAVEKGKILAHQMRQQGLTVELASYEWGTFYEDIKKGNFQMATMKWIGATEPDLYRVAFHSANVPPGRNRGYYKNPKLDSWLESGLKIENFEQRVAHYKKVQEEIFADMPILPLWYEKQFAIVHQRVKNFTLPANGDFSSVLRAFKEPPSE